jgi:hypothetical protein
MTAKRIAQLNFGETDKGSSIKLWNVVVRLNISGKQ